MASNGWNQWLKAEVDHLDAQCVYLNFLVLFVLIDLVRGTLLAFLKDGFITKWLERLKTLDTD